MEKRYLTISEFAGLRNVSIGSLRYYEKLKLLTPAWIDPGTKYRYYLPEQLGTLDIITLCIALDIPLKELKDYVDENGYLDGKRILEDGQRAMEEKIAGMQRKLELTRFSLDSMEKNQRYCGRTGKYTREIGERFILEFPLGGEVQGLILGEKQPMELFREAQERGMTPVAPFGLVLRCGREKTELSLYVQVLRPDESDGRVVRIPGGSYTCLQTELRRPEEIRRLLDENFPDRRGKTLILSDMLLNRLHVDDRRSEIQMLRT